MIALVALMFLVIGLVWVEVHIPGLLKALMIAGLLWWGYTLFQP